MKPKNVIVWILLLGIVVLLMSTSVQAKKEVYATDILEQIEHGDDVYHENVSIIGKLDLSKIELNTIPIARSMLEINYGLEEELKIVESKIEIRDSVFKDDVDFSNSQFRKEKDIDFSGTSFLGEINFSGAIFGGDADFKNADFRGDTYFRYADFGGETIFGNADFGGDVSDFENVVFGGPVSFRRADFSSDANFLNAKFSSYPNFGYANFGGKTIFGNADFGGDVSDFENVVFGGTVSFRGANFRGDTYFRYVNFSSNAEFRYANFGGNATFDSTEFNKVTFTRATFTNVSLIESDFNQMKVEWSSLKDALVFDGPTYIKIIKNFREIEQFDDADAAYYKYRQLSQKNKKWSFSKLMDVVAWLSCGYGVKPGFALIWAFVLIMVFALVYWLGDGITRLKEKKGDKNRVSRWAAFYNAFYFSVVTFTTVGYGDWYPKDRYRIVVMIEGVLGWLLLALFIVTLANVMIRP